jgi:hypothetical protein
MLRVAGVIRREPEEVAAAPTKDSVHVPVESR